MSDFKWPWVSRYRLEEAQQRLTAADQERLRLLDLLLEGNSDRERVRAMAASSEVVSISAEERRLEQEERAAAPTKVEQYSTPFDRVEANFDRARKGGVNMAKFVARVN